MAQQDIYDGGSIIGYRPNLKYEKELNQEAIVTEAPNENQTFNGEVDYSKTLQGFIESCPYETLRNLQASSEYMQKLIEKLSAAFHGNDYEEYGSIAAFLTALHTGSDEFAMEFLNHHKYDINGSQIPELIQCIYCAQERVDNISSTLKQLYYTNKNISVLDSKEIDDAYIAQLRLYENSNSTSKINYYALAVDSELNRIIITHTYGINKMAMRIAKVPDLKDDSTASSADMELVKNLFKEVNAEIDGRTQIFNTQQSIDIMEKTLYNYYQKRKSALGLYTLFSNSQSSSLFGQKLQEKQANVDEALRNIARSLRATELYTTEFARLEQEKHFLKDVYSSFNYNSNK